MGLKAIPVLGDWMRLLVYEYLSSGAWADSKGPSSLQNEGLAMLLALLTDLCAIPGLKLDVLLNPDLSEKIPTRVTVRSVMRNQDEATIFQQCLRNVDAVWLIAPEFHGILEERTRWCEQAGIRVVGSTSDAVRMTGDKETFSRVLIAKGIPTPHCLQTALFPGIVKPRDGAGSQATFLVRTPQELADAIAQARQEGWQGHLIQQPFVSGDAVSVAVLVGHNQTIGFPAGWQRLSQDGRFHYQGGEIPLPAEMQQRAVQLATRAIQAIPGLRGYIGVDLVLGEVDQVIEINPRLTTSYVGYRALANFNIPEAVLASLDLIPGNIQVSWKMGSVCFSSGGHLLPSNPKPANIGWAN